MPNNPADVQLLFRAMLIRVLQEDIVGDATAEQTADRIMAVLHPRSDKECASMVSEAMEITKRPSSEWIAGERIAASVLLRQMSAALLAPRAAEEADRARICELEADNSNVRSQYSRALTALRALVETGRHCAYCKQILSGDDAVKAHMESCEAHPLAAARAALERLAKYPESPADEMSASTMRAIARQALSGGSENG